MNQSTEKFLDVVTDELAALKKLSPFEPFNKRFKTAILHTCQVMPIEEIADVLAYMFTDFAKADKEMTAGIEKHASKNQKDTP